MTRDEIIEILRAAAAKEKEPNFDPQYHSFAEFPITRFLEIFTGPTIQPPQYQTNKETVEDIAQMTAPYEDVINKLFQNVQKFEPLRGAQGKGHTFGNEIGVNIEGGSTPEVLDRLFHEGVHSYDKVGRYGYRSDEINQGLHPGMEEVLRKYREQNYAKPEETQQVIDYYRDPKERYARAGSKAILENLYGRFPQRRGMGFSQYDTLDTLGKAGNVLSNLFELNKQRPFMRFGQD